MACSSGILRLVAKSDYDKHNYASQIHTIKANTNVNQEIYRQGDICLFESFIIPNSYSFDLFETFEIIAGHTVLWSIPFDLLVKLSFIKKTKNNNVICIPKSIFSSNNFDGIILLYFGMCPIVFNLKCKRKIEYSINFRYYHLVECDTRRNIISTYRNQLINAFEEFKFHDTKSINNLPPKILYNSTGIFIKTNKKLNMIQLNFCAIELFKYDNFMIKYAGKEVSKYKWDINKKSALKETLLKFVPMDVVNIINEYAVENTEYFYWIPFEPHAPWTSERQFFMKTDLKDIKINFDTEYSGSLYFMHSKMLLYGWGCQFSDEKLDVMPRLLV